MSVYVMDATTEEVRFLARCPARSGNGRGDCDNRSRSVLVSQTENGSSLSSGSWISSWSTSSGRGASRRSPAARRVPTAGKARHPSWAPSRELIAFSGARARSTSFAATAPAGEPLMSGTLQATFDHLNREPVGMVTGRHEAHLLGDTKGIYVVGADGLRSCGSSCCSTAIKAPSRRRGHPTDDGIVYINIRGTEHDENRAEIRVVRPDGTSDRLLYRSSCCIQDWAGPAFSPDGTLVDVLPGGRWDLERLRDDRCRRRRAAIARIRRAGLAGATVIDRAIRADVFAPCRPGPRCADVGWRDRTRGHTRTDRSARQAHQWSPRGVAARGRVEARDEVPRARAT